LTALDQRVVFRDDKEGMLGLRVRRELEQPSNEPLVFTDASGRPTTVKVMDNTASPVCIAAVKERRATPSGGRGRVGRC